MMSQIELSQLGWNASFDNHFKSVQAPDLVPARVISQERDVWLVATADGELSASITGRFRNESELFPAVGDWVAVQPLPGEPKGIIRGVLPRKTAISRQAAGPKTAEQVIAANVDSIFVVAGLDGGRNFNIRRLERYLTLAWNSGAAPVILLNKADLCPDTTRFVLEAEEIAPGVPVHAVSAITGTGLETLRDTLNAGSTGVFVGSSGAGKSAKSRRVWCRK